MRKNTSIAQILDRYKAGEAIRSINRHISSQALYKLVDAHGIPRRRRSRDVKILDMYKAGALIDDITAKYRCSVQTLYKLIDAHGLERRCKGQLLSPAQADILKRLKSGQSPLKIAIDREVSIATVYVQIYYLKNKTGCETIKDLIDFELRHD